MDGLTFFFKSLAILHTVAGYLFFGLAANEPFQEMFYENKNPLAGDLLKYSAYFGCWSLIACGPLAFFIPVFAVAVAWLSLVFFLATAAIELISTPKFFRLTRASVVSGSIRMVAAVALTATMPSSLYG